jgi:GntR family transcriptional regulator
MATGTAAYRVLADKLRDVIVRQDFEADRRLPTEAELASRYRVSRQTVRRAFQDLVAEGLVHRIPGRGTFATHADSRYLRHLGSIEDLMGLSIDTELEVVEPLSRRIDIEAAGRLRLPEDRVAATRIRRTHRDDVFCVTDIFLPPAVADLLADASELSSPGSRSAVTMIGLLDARLDRPITQAEQSVTAITAGATEGVTQILEVDDDAPLLRIDRMYLDGADVPVELAVSYFRPDRFSYRLKLKRSAT